MDKSLWIQSSAQRFAASSGKAIVSDLCRPLILTTFHGTLGLDVVRQHAREVTAVFERANAEREPIVHIIDARGITMPSARVRRFWADRIHHSSAILEALLGTFVVLDTTLMRGTLTTTPSKTTPSATAQIVYVPSVEVAVALANVALAERGVPPISVQSLTGVERFR